MSNRKTKSTRREGRNTTVPPGQPGNSQPKALSLRILLLGVFAAIVGFGLFAYWKQTQPSKPLHAFSSAERKAFMESLQLSGVPTQSVWLSCPEGKPEICRLVKQFVPMFQESGWRVEGNQVVQWKPAHPLAGVYLILQAAGEPDEPTRISEKRLRSSFTSLGIPVQSASAPDVPRNSVGIYFGPDM